MTNDSNDPEWIRCVRTFIATEDSVFLTRAVAACSDFTIREFLRQPGVREYTTPRGEYEQLAARLNGYGRQVEAGVIALLGLRGYLVVASHPEALTEQQQEQTRDSCAHAISLCQYHGFLECEARFLFAVAHIFARLHDYPKAEECLERAVDLYRPLEVREPTVYRRFLATSLNNLGSIMGSQGDSAKAKQYFEEALKMRRLLAETDPTVYLPEVATTLLNIARLLHDGDDKLSEIRTYAESLAIYRELAKSNPEDYGSLVAGTESTLHALREAMRQPEDESLCSVPTWTLHARQFVATGNPRCLLKAAQSCMDRRIRKFIEQCQEDSLSYKNCQRFVADLRTERRDDEATMIELLFLREGALEADTIDAAHEDESVAEDVCRYLVDVSHNSGFVECEALFCATLGRRYATLKEWRRAQALLWHAAELYKGLVASGAEIYRPFGARTLIIWANVLLQMREYSKAAAAAEGAVQFFRTLERSEHELASALNTYGNVLCEQHEFQASERALNEALSLYRGLNLENPGAFAADIGVVLNNLGNVLAEMLDLAGARRAYEEAVDVQRELANTDRDIFRPELARTLGNLGNLLARARDFGSSLLAHEESIKIYQQLREARPRLYDPDTATGLTNFGRVLMAERKFEGARHAFDQARDIFQELARAERDIYSRDVALSLHNLALVAAEEGDLDAARRLYTQSLRIFLELAEKDLKAYQPHVADTLQSLGDVLFNGGHLPEAKEAFDQTLRIRRELTKANDAYMTDVQATLNRLGVLLTECGDFNDAETMFDEALRIGRKLAIDAPHMFGPTVARTLSDYMAMLDKTPADVHVIDLCLEAIHWAESCSSDEARLWLAKGEAFRAYQRFLGHLAAGNSPDATFRCLTALREGRVQALGDHPEQGLSAAAASVADLSAHVGRKCNILIAQELTDSQTLLGILSSNEQAPLYICQVRGLATAARSLFSGIIRGFFADDQRNAQSSRQEAVVHARNIWALFPERVRQVLHPSCSDDVHISGDAFWAVFPWELLHYGEDEDDWLGLQRPLARWSPITAGSISRLRATTFGDGSLSATVFSPWDVNDDRLTGSREEASNISHRLASELGYELVPGNVPYLGQKADRETFEEALSNGRLALVHFTGHGAIVGTEEVLLLHRKNRKGDVAYFGRTELEALCQSLDRSVLLDRRPLVVLNSCFSGRTRQFGGNREDLAWSLLSHGAEAVIANALPVFDDSAKSLGELIYQIDEPNMGRVLTVVRKTSEKNARANNSAYWYGWALTTYHGNPYARLPHLKQS